MVESSHGVRLAALLKRSLLFVPVALLFGCATIFHTSPPSAEIVGPANVSAQNTRGEEIPTTVEDGVARIFPERGRDDSIVISYGAKRHTVALARRINPWDALDFFTAGPGFFVDDLSNAWYSYAPVYVHIDSSHNDFAVSSSDLIGEPAGTQRPELLLLGGMGMWMRIFTLPGEAAIVGPLPEFLVKFQGGFGVDLYKKVELFYLAQDDPSFNVNNPLAGLGIPNTNSDVTTQSIAARYFLEKNTFVQASLGYGQVEVDTFGSQPSNSNNSYQLFSNQFPVIGVGIGWAGDISYVALQYALATKRYMVDGQTGTYNSLYLELGMNLRF